MEGRLCPMESMALAGLDFYRGRRVFITGHTGFKGSWLARILLLAGAEVTGYSLDPLTEPSLHRLVGISESINSIRGDVRDLESLKSALGDSAPEVVIHLAAQPLVRQSYEKPVETYSTNVMGTVNILEAVRETPTVRSFVNVTTDKVYENREWIWGYREHETLCGYDPYSNSKSCSELVTYSYRRAFFDSGDSPAISTARSGNVIGGGDFAQDRIIPDCVRAASQGTAIIVRNPDSTRPYQHVLECLSGYLMLAERQYSDKSYEGAYNFGPDDSGCVSTGTLVKLFCDAWGNLGWRIRGDAGPHEATFLKLDCSKAKTRLGWQPRLSTGDAVGYTVEWAKAYLDGGDFTAVMDRQIHGWFRSR